MASLPVPGYTPSFFTSRMIARMRKLRWLMATFELALVAVLWLCRPTTDPRLMGKWVQPAGAIFDLRADGTGTFHYPTVTTTHTRCSGRPAGMKSVSNAERHSGA